jgi:nucleolar GTP-binding protein
MYSIPNSRNIVDLILSKTQRKTPTIIHKQYSIQRIRNFYIRKLKFFEQNFKFLIDKVLKNFPLIDQLHPFFCDLLNAFFNRNNYKISLNNLYRSKIHVSVLVSNHIKLLKHANSLYNCKQIKKAGLGTICKKIKKINKSFIYLEKIRCHIKKLPQLDPHRKIILLVGSSGVGKSCCMNKLTRTNTLVKNKKNTTKFLTLGHVTNKFFKWQVIDTPGISKSDLTTLSLIEMQSLIAIANLNFRLMYFFDFKKKKSSIRKQIRIFMELRKLHKKKEKIFILNKSDLGWEKNFSFLQKSIINFIQNHDNNKKSIFKTSFHDETGVLDLKDRSFFLGKISYDDLKLKKLKKKNFEKKKLKKTEFLHEKTSVPNFYKNINNDTIANKNDAEKFFFSNNKIQNFFSKTSKPGIKNNYSREEKLRRYLFEKEFSKINTKKIKNIVKMENFMIFYPKKFENIKKVTL